MAVAGVEGGGEDKKHNDGSNQSPLLKESTRKWFIPVVLRVVSFLALASATIVMALDKQTKTFVVATVGTTPIKATLTAKFHHTPAFVFFVIANSMGSLHNLLMLAIEFFGNKFDNKGFRYVLIPILDMLTVTLVSAGAGGSFFVGELGRNGNSHARWNKICDKFDTFCDHALGAFIASFIGQLLLMTITMIAIINLRNRNSLINYSSLP